MYAKTGIENKNRHIIPLFGLPLLKLKLNLQPVTYHIAFKVSSRQQYRCGEVICITNRNLLNGSQVEISFL